MEILPLVITKPDGSIVTVPVPAKYPGAVTVSVAVPGVSPCTQIVPTLVVVTLGKVYVAAPTALELLETLALPVPLAILTMTAIAAPGALPSSTLTGVSMLTPVVVLPMLAFSAATTLAVIC